MNKTASTLVLGVSLFLASGQISFAAEDSKNTAAAKPPMNNEAWERVNKAQAESEEAKALAQKVEAETRLQEAVFKLKMTELLNKARLESALSAEGAEKTRNQARQAEAEASLNEALLRSVRAKNEGHVPSLVEKFDDPLQD